MSETAICGLCGHPMPEGEEMFQYHGFSGDCPGPPLKRDPPADPRDLEIAALKAEVERLTRERDEATKRAQDVFTAFEVARRKP